MGIKVCRRAPTHVVLFQKNAFLEVPEIIANTVPPLIIRHTVFLARQFGCALVNLFLNGFEFSQAFGRNFAIWCHSISFLLQKCGLVPPC